MLKYYEGMFLTQNKESKNDTDFLREHVQSLIEKVGGKVEKIVKWDERRLAYPIKGVKHGVYFLTHFTGDGATDAKLRTEVRMSGLILRHLVLSLDEITDEPLESFTEMNTRLSAPERREGQVSEGGERRERVAAPVGVGASSSTSTEDAKAPTTEATQAKAPSPPDESTEPKNEGEA